MRRALLLLVALLSFADIASAQTTELRVVVVASDVQLVAALGEALTAWHVSLILVEETGPGPTTSSASERGAELADTHGAQAVVWLSTRAETWAIWIYDADSGRTSTRPLPVGPPFDEPTAAALALSVMTMLRHSTVAPPDERIDGGADAESQRAARQRPNGTGAEASSVRQFRLELAGGAEGWASTPDQVEPRFALSTAYWPSAWDGIAGFELVFRLGTGLPVDRAVFSGRLIDARAVIRGHLRAGLNELVFLGALLGVGSRISLFEGTHASGRAVSELQARGLLEVAAEVALEADPFVVSARVGLTVTPWIYEYEADRVPVLESTYAWPFAELGLEMGFR